MEDLIIFRLWGAVEAYQGGRRVEMGNANERCLLVGLIAADGKPVPRDSLHEWIWHEVPARASDDVHTYMTRLRRRLRDLGLQDVLINKDRLCRLEVPPASVDSHQVRDLLVTAKESPDARAAKLLRTAMRLSSGEPLVGLDSPRINTYRSELEKDRLATQIAYYQIEIRAGRSMERLGELGSLFETHPGDTMVTALMMCALYSAGRQVDLHPVYLRHRSYLDSEFGVDVSVDLRGLHEQLLNGDLVHDKFPLARKVTRESIMDTSEPLLIAVHTEGATSGELTQSVVGSVMGTECRTEVVDDCVVYSVPATVEPARVVGVWIDEVYRAVRERTGVGISVADENSACELARSAAASGMLDNAEGSSLAVAVSDEVYQSVVLAGGRKIDPRSYRRTATGWVRIPGWSTPPRIAEMSPTSTAVSAPAFTAPVNLVNGKQTIRKQVNASVINKYRGRDR